MVRFARFAWATMGPYGPSQLIHRVFRIKYPPTAGAGQTLQRYATLIFVQRSNLVIVGP